MPRTGENKRRIFIALLFATASCLGLAAYYGLARPPRPAPLDTDALLMQAEREIDRGNTADANSLLNRILRVDATNGMALLYRGQLARERGDSRAALADWRNVGDAPAKVAGTARYLEGTLILEQGRARDAERLFLESAELNPQYVQPLDRLRELYLIQARRDDVHRVIDRVGRIRPWTFDELIFRIVPPERATIPDVGAKLAESYVAADPDDVNSALAPALHRLEGEHAELAVTPLAKLRERVPNDVRVAALLSDARLRLGDANAAQTTLEPFPADETSSAILWRSHGRLAAKTGDWERAAECFRKVVELHPEDGASLYRLGEIYRRLGRDDEAKRMLERSTTIDRMQREALRIIWGRRDDPTLLLPIVVEVGRTLHQLGYITEASRWYERALAIKPDEPTAHEGMRAAIEAVRQNPTLAQNDPFGPHSDHVPDAKPAALAQHHLTRPDPAKERPNAALSIALCDIAVQVGLDFTYFNGDSGFKHIIESVGGGVAVLDYERDGRPDVYFPQGSRYRLIRPIQPIAINFTGTSGRRASSRISEKAGIVDNFYGQGVTAGDYDNDGFDEVVVANYGRSTFYRNNGDGTFTEASQAVGLSEANEISSSVAFTDLNLDGLPDLYVVNYVSSLKVCQNNEGAYFSCSPTNFDGQQDRLYQNLGDGSFREVTSTSGITVPGGKGLGIVAADLDDDARPDLYVANDTMPNFLYRNVGADGEFRFLEEGLTSGTAVSGEGRAQAGMGIACDDFNGDGRLDLFVTNFYQEPNTLYLNLGNGLFEDSTRSAGLADPSFDVLGFGTQAVDFNLDGTPDLFVANGHIDDFRAHGEPWKMRPQLYSNDGDAKFADVSSAAGGYFEGEYLGRGVARLDFDGDGRPDLAVVHQDRPVGLLHNETIPTGRSLVLELHGVVSNRNAIGAKISVSAKGRNLTRQICGGDGFFASNEKRQIIGLGDASRIDKLEIHWPSGQVDMVQNVSSDIRLVCIEGRKPIVADLAARDRPVH